jgi:hypothetical protein
VEVKGSTRNAASLFSALILGLCLLLTGCSHVALVTDYDEQFDKQLTEFQKEYDSFIYSVLLSKDDAEADYYSQESQDFYTEIIPQRMNTLVNRALLNSLKTPSLPTPIWGAAKENKCPSVVSFQCPDRQAQLPKPPDETEDEKEFTASWNAYKQFVFLPICTDHLDRCCLAVSGAGLSIAIKNSNTTSICLLNSLWKNLEWMATIHWRASNKNKRLNLSQIRESREALLTVFRNLSFFEQQKLKEK